jgi:hypothetical protein
MAVTRMVKPIPPRKHGRLARRAAFYSACRLARTLRRFYADVDRAVTVERSA